MAEHPIQGLMNVTMEKIHQMVDSNTIIGKPITTEDLSLIHISEPTRRTPISYAVFCLKKKKKHETESYLVCCLMLEKKTKYIKSKKEKACGVNR